MSRGFRMFGESYKERPTKRVKRLRLKFFFAWYDAWLGLYYDRSRKVLYFCPVPCCVISFQIVDSFKYIAELKQPKGRR